MSHRVIFHGRRVCHARKPACGACTLAADCPSYGTGPDRPGPGRGAGQGPEPGTPAAAGRRAGRRCRRTGRRTASTTLGRSTPVRTRSRPPRTSREPAVSSRAGATGPRSLSTLVGRRARRARDRRAVAAQRRSPPPAAPTDGRRRPRRTPTSPRCAPPPASSPARRRAAPRRPGRSPGSPCRASARRAPSTSGPPSPAGRRCSTCGRRGARRAGPSCPRWPSTRRAPDAVPVLGVDVQDDPARRAGAAARAGRHAAVGHRPGRRAARRARRAAGAADELRRAGRRQRRPGGPAHSVHAPRTRWPRPSSGSGPVIGDAPAARARARVAAPAARRHPRRRRGHAEPPRHPAAGRRAPQRRAHPVRRRSRARPGRAAHRAGQHPALARRAGGVPRRPDRPDRRATRWRPPCARPRRRPGWCRRGSSRWPCCPTCSSRRPATSSRRCIAHWADPTAVHAVDPSETATVVRVPVAVAGRPARPVPGAPSVRLRRAGVLRGRAGRLGFHGGPAVGVAAPGRLGTTLGRNEGAGSGRGMGRGASRGSGGRGAVSL